MNQTQNILFLFPDQMRADFLGCYGADFVETPHIDSLAAEGIRCERALSHAPVCVPARASLLTGRNALKNGVLDNNHWLHPEDHSYGIRTWPELLSEAGYATAAVGKMHFYPFDAAEGFQERRIAEDKRFIYLHDDYAEYLEQHGYRKYHGAEHAGYFEQKGAMISRIPAENQVDRWVAEQTIDYLRGADGDRPFAVMSGFPGPHCPYDPPEEYLDRVTADRLPSPIPPTAESDRYKPIMDAGFRRFWNQVDYSDLDETHIRKIRHHYAALIAQIDDCVGTIIAALKDLGLYDNTMIIFTSDHGDFVGDYRLMGKQLFYESAIRVPLIIKPPGGRPEPQTWPAPVSLTDINATILDTAGVRYSKNDDSIALPYGNTVNSGSAQPAAGRREYLFGINMRGCMLVKDNWKLIRYSDGCRQLFDTDRDPLEQHNLADTAEHEAVRHELEEILWREMITSAKASHEDKLVHETAGLGKGRFGRPGWQRPYPCREAAEE